MKLDLYSLSYLYDSNVANVYGPLSKLFINRQIAFMELVNDHFIFIGSGSCTIIRHVILRSVFLLTLSLDKGSWDHKLDMHFCSDKHFFNISCFLCFFIFTHIFTYDLVNSNTVNSKFHLIQFFYHTLCHYLIM